MAGLLIRASARKAPDTARDEAAVELVPRWQSSRATPASRPSLRVHWRTEGDDLNPSTTHVLDAPGGQGGVIFNGTFLPAGCELEDDCDWHLVLDLEVQGELGEDVVEVDWKVMASVEAFDTDEAPDGFRVEISEP